MRLGQIGIGLGLGHSMRLGLDRVRNRSWFEVRVR